MSKEEFRDVKGYEGLYQVSNLGSVKSLGRFIEHSLGGKAFIKERLLKKDIVKGYQRVTFSKNNNQLRTTVHRLVAINFIDNNKGKKCVNHINGIKTDNRVDNLEWCTHSENERHSINVLGKINNNRKLNDNSIIDIRRNAIKRVNTKEYAKKYSVDISTILNVLNNKYYV